ncbi:Ankyrin repeat domain-containing protein 60 [Penicillium rubens]|nr:Ankyrin repeat domain-containing protein 60 [Penicillium rubens]
MLATQLRYADAVDLLLSHHSVKVIQCNTLGESAFSIAVLHGSVKIVERLLNVQNVDLNNQSLDGIAPISVALTCRQTYVFQLLLSDERTNVNICDHHGQTPLHLATEIGDYGAIQMLVRNPRVDVNCFNHRQETPLLLAVKGHGRFLPIHKRLLIIEALLLSPCLNLNYQDENGRTAIWYAVSNSDLKLVELLLQQTNLDLNCADKLGQTPLAKAAANGSLDLIKVLFRQPGLHKSPSPQFTDAFPPLWSACRAGQFAAVEFLLQNSADINQISPSGTSPLEVAIIMEHVDIVHLLVSSEKSLLINDQNHCSSFTALMFASALGKVEIVKILLEHPNINVNAVDDQGRTSFWWAAAGGHYEVVQLLANRRGVKKRLKDSNGQTAYAIAEQRKHGHVMVYLRSL